MIFLLALVGLGRHTEEGSDLLCTAVVGAQEVLHEQLLRVPQDMALACFSNDPFTAMTQPQLTVIDQRPEQRAKPPCGSFCSCSSAGQPMPHLVLKPELIIRSSSQHRSQESLLSCAKHSKRYSAREI